ncbi:MAG TPA: hypothetical protein VED40_15085 [Azospirillaceae bacterium]|nr:hypothetical protein [Azospirillaceae bacterium]
MAVPGEALAPAAGLNGFLLAGGLLSAAASLLHLACILVGPSMYLALGAGRRMAEMAAAGHWYPTVMTLGIAGVLAAWAYFALAGAGLLPRPPLLKAGLVAVTAVYLLRGSAVLPILLAPRAADGSVQVAGAGGPLSFWIWSSAICLAIGAVHLAGLVRGWRGL